MYEAQYFMGVDTGTQSVRVVVADISGNIVASLLNLNHGFSCRRAGESDDGCYHVDGYPRG